MRRLVSFVIFVIVLAAVIHFGVREPANTATLPDPVGAVVPQPVGATLLPGMGSYSRAIKSKSPDVQKWFDQGLSLSFGFNHDAAERSFLKAIELDPGCAMCWWGAALVLGPHVNSPMDPSNNAKAWMRIKKAQATSADTSPQEQAYIQALSSRYAEAPPSDRTALDEAYAAAMSDLVRKYPDDLDAATLHAEALMDLQPWNYYDEQRHPKGHTTEIVAALESVMARNPDHPGALHLYIHAIEASTDPDRGAVAADRLRGLVPGSGHLVHMPAHIYSRVGRYDDAARVNELAIAADDNYLATCRPAPGIYPLGYVPHNHHFLWWATSMEGASGRALAAAEETAKRTSDPELLRSPGFEFLHDFWVTPLKAQVTFGRWDQIVTTPKPPAEMPYAVAVWEFAQGMAAVRQRRLEDAQAHWVALEAASRDPAIEKIYVGPQHSLGRTVIVGERILAGELAAARQDVDAALAALRQAVAEEDANPYFEPPLWHQPSRQNLGQALLKAARPAEAEAVFREDLRRNRGNGWSLRGLVLSLEAQGKPVAEEQAAFEQAWKHADFKLNAAVL